MSDFADILQQALAPGYTLERELTGGGMSRVFVATDVALARKVVVKVLPPELAAGVNHERFRREIQVAAQLQHPHVVPLLSAGEQGTLIWYTMPFINGQSLREAIAGGASYAIKDVVRIMRDVAEALDYAHGLGVIHRDIKPGNVLLMGSHALVTDFGVAKAISASMPSSGFTSAGMAIGTPAYMAPEQIAADPAADHRMDLYALGLLGYEMLTGKVPFKEDSPQKTMAAQLTREPAPLAESRGDVPPPLAALIARLLAKLPEERPQDASEVVTALDDIALTSGQHLAPIRPTRKPSVGRTLGLVAAGAAVIATAWIAGEQSATETVSEAFRDSLATADSMEVVSSAAAMLTREDSMAIAKAVSDRLARPVGRTDPAAIAELADSIRQQIQRAVLDSLVQLGARMGVARTRVVQGPSGAAQIAEATALATNMEGALDAGRPPGPPPGMRSTEPRRVVVAPPRPSRSRPDVDKVAAALVDSLRLRIDASPRYMVIAADSVAAALRESRTIDGVKMRLSADFIVSVSLVPSKDSVVRLITVHDLHAAQGMDRRVIASPVLASDPTAGIGAMMPQVLPMMVEMERARFRQMPPRPPAQPQLP
ncbi:MAG: serine/threonine protein kinase [Gemmatimonadetes bacterium]|nr:serine/threonine protein kinase [Gemmatimonadota bacterium]